MSRRSLAGLGRVGQGALALAVVTGAAAGCSSQAGAPAAHPRTSASAKSSSAPAKQPARPPRLHTRTLAWRLPKPLARESAVLLPGGRVLVGGGLFSDDTSSAATYTLDLRTGHIAPQRPLPVEVHDTAGVALGHHVLVLGGGNASEQAVVQSPVGHRWQVVGRLPTPRSDLTAVTVGHRAYVVGGYDGTSPALPEVLATGTGRAWTVASRLPLPVRYPATVAIGHALWVFGGERNGAEVDAVQRVDLATGRARVVGHLPHPVGHEAAAVLGGRVLLAGGRRTTNALTGRMWWFDPGSGKFSPAGRLPTPRADTAVVQPDHGTAYLIGGETPAFSDRVVRLRWR